MILFVYLAISSSFLFSNGYHHQRCQSRSIIRNQNVLFQSEPTSNFIEQQQRPRPVGLPRRRMELPFAVLLMRTSYSVADDLDFVAMDEFQRSFFLYRQSEWESYRDQHPRVMQGDLADPAYFDFISFAQYVVLSDKMKNGKVDFVEKVSIFCVDGHINYNIYKIGNQYFYIIGRS